MNRPSLFEATALCAALGSLWYLVHGVRRGAFGRADSRWSARVGVPECDGHRLAPLAEPRSIALEALALALKELVPRARPAKHRFEPNGDQSFPSTHTANATALATALAAIGARRTRTLWPFLPSLAVGLALGKERIRGAAHWPTDVAAGLLLGIAGTSAASLLLTLDHHGR